MDYRTTARPTIPARCRRLDGNGRPTVSFPLHFVNRPTDGDDSDVDPAAERSRSDRAAEDP
jgi:hypothetical protein